MTIIVLLILAGVTIAMLTGENGILTNASNAKAQNAYYTAQEQAKLAYMTVRTEIMTQTVGNSTYDATSGENTKKLGELVEKDLDPKQEKKTWKVEYGTAGKITMTYSNDVLGKDAIATGKPKNDHKIEYEITLSAQGATLKEDGVEVSNGGSSSTGGGSSTVIAGLTDTAGTAITAASLTTVGQDFKIGNETFRVINPDKNGKVVAMPWYNITLTETPVQKSSSAGSTKFVNSSSDVTWSAGADIEMDKTNNLVQDYIEAYEEKTLPAGVTARIARYDDVKDDAITLPSGTTLTKNQIRNPGQSGFFWLGSANPYDASSVRTVSNLRQRLQHPCV